MENYKTEKVKIDSVLHIKTYKKNNQNKVLFHLVNAYSDTYYELVDYYEEQKLKYKGKVLYITYYSENDIFKRKKVVNIHTQQEFLTYINTIMISFLEDCKKQILNEDFHYQDNMELYLRKYARDKKLKFDTEKAIRMLLSKFPNIERLKLYYRIKFF